MGPAAPVVRTVRRVTSKSTSTTVSTSDASSVNFQLTVRDAVLGEAEPLPGAPIDLIVLSEVLYYLPADEVAVAVGKLLDLAAPGADVVAVHWRHPIDGMELDGDGVHRRLAEMPRLDVIGSWTEADFRIDVLRLR